jgi:hypothetical protein
MFWIIPLTLNFAIVLISYLVGRAFTSTDGSDVDVLLPFVALMQSTVVWGLFGVYWLNDCYWGLSS